MRQPLLPDHVEREREPRGDAGAGAEGVRPRTARRLRQRSGSGLGGDVEEPEQRLQLPCRRVRRQGLIGGVGEQDQAVGAVRADEPVERGGDARVRVGRDARRDIEHDDPAGRCGQQRPGLRRLAERADQERDHGRDRNGGAGEPQPPDGGRSPFERGTVAERDRGRATPLRSSAGAHARRGRRASSHRAARARGATRRCPPRSAPARAHATTREARLAARRRSSASRVADSRRSLTARSRSSTRSGSTRTGPLAPQRSREHDRADGEEADAEDSEQRRGGRGRNAVRRTGKALRATERGLGRLDGRGGHARAHRDLDPRRDGNLAAGEDAGARQRDGCSPRPSRQAAARQAIVSDTVMWPTPSVTDRCSTVGATRVKGATSFTMRALSTSEPSTVAVTT